MKSSSQTLMLAILMGLVAWLMDALISWHFFPGKTFYEMLFEYDPQRTLYVRSSVVMLFFIFGLFAGRLVQRHEQIQKNLEQSLTLLEGVRTFHEQVVQSRHERDFLLGSLPLIVSTFDLHRLCFFPVRGGQLERTAVCADPRGCESDKIWQRIKDIPGISQPDPNAPFQWLPGSDKTEIFLLPVQLGDRLFGIIYGENTRGALKNSERMKHFVSLCDTLGHALAWFQDHDALEFNARKLSTLYENAPVGIFTSTVGGELKFANPAMARLLGAENAEELLAQNYPIPRYYADPSRRDDFIQLLRTEKSVVDFEFDLVDIHQGLHSVLLAARLNEEGQEEPRVEGFAIDITQRKITERENRILQKQLTQSQHFKSITVLAGGVAHEFNNILQAMMGSAYLAQLKYGKFEDEIWGYLQDIQNSGKRAAKLCDQMLSYAGKKAMFLKVDFPEEALKQILKLTIANKSPLVQVQTELQTPEAQVRMDIPSFSEIVNQLISNAIEALPAANGTVYVSTAVREMDDLDFESYHLVRKLSSDQYWELKIEDTGVGISGEDLPHIFEPFFTTKFQGRGLGLPSIAGLIEKFDGSLGVRQRPQGGTEFALWIPLAETVLVEESAAPETEKPKTETPEFAGGVIWVVDDEPLICMTLERLLDRFGFEVRTANDGSDAWEKICKEDPEKLRCLILDVTMPVMGGLETLQHIRSTHPEVPVLIMSGYDESESLSNFSRLNVSGFIHKPFRMEQLRDKLQQILT